MTKVVLNRILICFYYTSYIFLATASVRLSLNGIDIANNSIVDIEDIGEGDETALLCHTNKTLCCGTKPNRFGDWYYPNGAKVRIKDTVGMATDEFYRDRGTQVVRLNHRQGNLIERGRFRCQVPESDDNDVMRSIYAYIGMPIDSIVIINISSFLCSVNISTIEIDLSAPLTQSAGNSLSLMCSSIISFIPPPRDMIFEWFFSPNGNASLPPGVTASHVTNISSNYTSTLEFSPLLPSHAGTYTCQLGGNQKLQKTAEISVNNCES